jgi:hypothetical protein
MNFRRGNPGVSFYLQSLTFRRIAIMNFNLFSVIAASAISASVVLPASAAQADKAGGSPQGYTQHYLQKSANFYAALNHKAVGTA